MSTIIESIERRQLRRVPRFTPGDRVRVHFQVIEGTRKRTQVFEGIVIARQGNGVRETFTVRKQSFGVGVERMFPLHSPKIERLEVIARGDVRRAKLYYLRGRVGKRARVAERRWGIEDELVSGADAEIVDVVDEAAEAPEAEAAETDEAVEAPEAADEAVAEEPVAEEPAAEAEAVEPEAEEPAAEEAAAEEPAADAEPVAAEGDEPAAGEDKG